tara:strand:+ start:70 stop:309 length:240 start_codon:yes stop_codon:yes gene_type:complete
MNKKIVLYRPNSFSEGLWFTELFCDNCIRQPQDPTKGSCNIYNAMHTYEKEEPEYPKELQEIMGTPTCLAFKKQQKEKS